MSPQQHSDSSQGLAAGRRRRTSVHTLTPAATHINKHTCKRTAEEMKHYGWRDEVSVLRKRKRKVILMVGKTKEGGNGFTDEMKKMITVKTSVISLVCLLWTKCRIYH